MLEVVDADVERLAALADDFDGFQCGGWLGLLLGLTFLAVERRERYLPRLAFMMIQIPLLSQQLGGRSLIGISG